MFFKFWLEGILIGILATAPLGPVAILVIQRTLSNGRKTGFYSAMGAALSDTLYATFTGFGMALIIGFIRQHETLVKLAGSAILIALGIFIFFSHPERHSPKKLKKRAHPMKYVAGTFAVAFSNPYIIFLHLAIFSGFSIALTIEKPYTAFSVLLGFLTGAVLWWFSLTWLINRFRSRFSIKILLWFNRIAGAAIVLFVLIYLATDLLN